jgi:ubiquinone/menaquinone biosynthesis C-methylase UbiE
MSERYYTHFAAAFVRGRLPEVNHLPDDEALRYGTAAGLRLHKFKRSAALPRVRRVLGVLRGVEPLDLLDVGSGRGVFLWPLLDAFPQLPVTGIDRRADRVADLHGVQRGGVARLRPAIMDVTRLALANDSVDVVTFLEVLEHLTHPARALAEAVRVARRFVIVSVPSNEDDNPEHLQLFNKASLETMLHGAGARRVSIDFVRDHIIAVAGV